MDGRGRGAVALRVHFNTAVRPHVPFVACIDHALGAVRHGEFLFLSRVRYTEAVLGVVHADYVGLHYLTQILVHHAEHLHDFEYVEVLLGQAQVIAQAL